MELRIDQLGVWDCIRVEEMVPPEADVNRQSAVENKLRKEAVAELRIEQLEVWDWVRFEGLVLAGAACYTFAGQYTKNMPAVPSRRSKRQPSCSPKLLGRLELAEEH